MVAVEISGWGENSWPTFRGIFAERGGSTGDASRVPQRLSCSRAENPSWKLAIGDVLGDVLGDGTLAIEFANLLIMGAMISERYRGIFGDRERMGGRKLTSQASESGPSLGDIVCRNET